MKNQLDKTHTPDAPGRGANGKPMISNLAQAALPLDVDGNSLGIPGLGDDGKAFDAASAMPGFLGNSRARRGGRRLTSQVSFKVSQKVAKRLESLGTARQMSIHAVARAILEQSLQEPKDSTKHVHEILKLVQDIHALLSRPTTTTGRTATPLDEAVEELRASTAAALLLNNELRRDIATAVCALLVQGGESPERAMDWVRTNLHSQE